MPQGNICPTCKFELQSEKDHGYVRVGFDEVTHRTIIKPCPTCSGGARTTVASREQSELVTRLFGGSQIPHRSQGWSFATYPRDADQAAKRQVEDFVARCLANSDEDGLRGLYLGGAAGRGKTGLAISALKACMDTGLIGLFVMTSDLMKQLRATYNKNSALTEDELLKAVTEVAVLVLDDLGVEKPSAHVIEEFYLIIEKRRSRGLITIITSNMSTKDLETYWRPDTVPEGSFHPGMRVVERLREYCVGISVAGRNQRMHVVK